DITYETFRRNIGGEALDTFAREMKYDTGNERGGLRLKDDWHVIVGAQAGPGGGMPGMGDGMTPPGQY
ncbi:MAG: hypothetical protein ABGZ35_24310, partial [Planctomycetaceae bacterium]